ncbi:MAG TPA: XylR N-terminal domain-containing protein [Roseiarcus sp.]|jgi:hypothetical protein
MRINDGQEALLDRGGHPTLRELFRQLVFSPGSGTIHLNKERLILQRANHASRLREQLVERYGRDEAFVILTRLGFVAGLEDADFVRHSWPALDPGDVFTAGTRLHMLCGCVRLRTVHNDFDLRKGRFSGEFIWQGSVEAVEYRRGHGPSDEAVCWSQVGYASGYATRCFGKLIVYKEVECLGCGRDACRVVGKPAESWGEDDALIRLYRQDVVPGEADGARSGDYPSPPDEADALSRLLLAPVRSRLEQIARFDAPLFILGEPGTGKRAAARAWSDARFGTDGVLDILSCDAIGPEALDAAFDRPIARPRGRTPKRSQRRIVLTDVDLLAAPLQRRLARRLDDGDTRIAATTRLGLFEISNSADFDQTLLHRLLVAPVVTPPLRSRRQDIPALADGLMAVTARRHGVKKPAFTAAALQAISALELRGNLTELSALVFAALIAASPGGEIGADLVHHVGAPFADRHSQQTPATSRAAGALESIASGALSLERLNDEVCRKAVERCGGNVSAAARMLNVTRPQLAYRLKRRRLDRFEVAPPPVRRSG